MPALQVFFSDKTKKPLPCWPRVFQLKNDTASAGLQPALLRRVIRALFFCIYE